MKRETKHFSDKMLKPWVAGFFDGEGCISMYVSEGTGQTPRPTLSFSVSICQSSSKVTEESIERWEEFEMEEHGHDPAWESLNRVRCLCERHDIDTNLYPIPKGEDENGVWVFKIASREGVFEFIQLIEEFLTVKHREADILINGIKPRLEHLDVRYAKDFMELVCWRDLMNKSKGGNRTEKDSFYYEDEWGIVLEENRYPIENYCYHRV